MFLLLEVAVLACSYLASQLQTTGRTVEPKHSLRGAGHAVLRTLYSRAYRIGLDGTSYLLRGPCESISLDLFLILIVGVLAQPRFELIITFKQDFQSLRNDVGRSGVDEFRVLIELRFHRLLDPGLDRH